MDHGSSLDILFVGDMHLGRLPSRVPDSVLDRDTLQLRDLGPEAAWNRIVDDALERRVAAVALAGDLVEKDNAMFEAYGPLATGVRRLVEAGILVAAVAGNHDTAVLPKLAAEIEGFHLLGPGGTWSTVDVHGEDGFKVRLAGWSFPSRHHRSSPLMQDPPRPEGITLGLLHADLDVSRSQYAPVRSADLVRTGYAGWFLGHVHIPGMIPSDGAPFYLGSTTGLDPNETGPHGPVLVRVSPGGKITAERLPLAPLRWEHRDIDCTPLEDPADQLGGHLIRHLKRLQVELEPELDEVRALGIRFTLTGSVADPTALDRAWRELEDDDLVVSLEGATFFVGKIFNRVTGNIDLKELARRDDPPGLMARQILALEAPGQEVTGIDDSVALANTLTAEATQAVARVDIDTTFTALAAGDEEMSPARIREMLIQAGRRALAGLLAQMKDKEADRAVG